MLSLEGSCKQELGLSWQHFKNVCLSRDIYLHPSFFKKSHKTRGETKAYLKRPCGIQSKISEHNARLLRANEINQPEDKKI